MGDCVALLVGYVFLGDAVREWVRLDWTGGLVDWTGLGRMLLCLRLDLHT